MPTTHGEMFEIINDAGEVIGIAPRRCCHGNPALRHRAAHVVVMASDGRVLLQKRSPHKDIQPGKWDSAVGGHLQPGEDFHAAACREMAEEIGVIAKAGQLAVLFDMTIRNQLESEVARVFAITCDGPFQAPPDEIDELRFWSWADINAASGTGVFTPNLKKELALLHQHLARSGAPCPPQPPPVPGLSPATTP